MFDRSCSECHQLLRVIDRRCSKRNFFPSISPPGDIWEKEIELAHVAFFLYKTCITLEEENRRLREARLCKICMDSEVCIVFLPCSHLVTCVSCAQSLAACPVCRHNIKATVRTFLS
ncbi:Baculoviral IAP repeat-containing protein 2 [Homalodisca vitripennis]|nr:Baculoviral IAP repeat-containing protein 2 [Homalodisca vitripennis]